MPTPETEDPTLLLLREDVGGAYEAVARAAAEAVGAAACDLALYDPGRDEIIARRPRYSAPGQEVPEFPFRLETSRASHRVVRTGRSHVTNDPAHDPLYSPELAAQGVRSILTVPVLRSGRVVGLIYALNKPGGFSDADVATLTALASTLAATLENVRLFALERERRVLNESLSSLSRAVVDSPSEAAAMQAVLDHMSRVVRFQGGLAVVGTGAGVHVAATRGLPEPKGGPTTSAGLEELLDAWPVRPLTRAACDRLEELGLSVGEGSALGASLRSRGRILGAIAVAFASDQPVSAHQERIVHAFAEHAAFFLGAGALVRREREAREREAALVRIARMAATRLEAEPFLRSAAPEILRATGADRAALYLKHPQKAELYPSACDGASAGELVPFWERVLPLESGPLSALAAQRRPLIWDDGAEPPPELTPFRGTRSLALAPLVFRDEVVGALSIAFLRQPQAFPPDLLSFLEDLAQHLALGVGNARLFATLTELATVDSLTGLANRRRFGETLRHELARARRDDTPLTLVLGDLDHLKRINDAFGHPTGDRAIQHVAEAFRRGRREVDLAARMGGEEFALLLPRAPRDGGVTAAQRIVRDLSRSRLSPVGKVTASLGLATFPDDAATEEDLIRIADERLYAAKSAGRNRLCYSDS